MYPKTNSRYDYAFKFITQLQLAGISTANLQPSKFHFFSFFEFYRPDNWAVILPQ